MFGSISLALCRSLLRNQLLDDPRQWLLVPDHIFRQLRLEFKLVQYYEVRKFSQRFVGMRFDEDVTVEHLADADLATN